MRRATPLRLAVSRPIPSPTPLCRYLQQSNEINSERQKTWWWNSDGGDSNLYGLEVSSAHSPHLLSSSWRDPRLGPHPFPLPLLCVRPSTCAQPNYGCCTANHPQGFPKFITASYMLTQRPGQPLGLVAAILGPSSVSVTLNGTNRVRVLQETEYPFAINPTIRFVLRADAPFPFSMRVPSWAVGATLTDASGQSVKVANGSIHEYLYTPSSSNASTTVSLRLPTSFRVERRYNNAVSVYYGGLLMALDMDFNVTVLRQYAFHSQDLQMLPTTPWAYALQLDEAERAGQLHHRAAAHQRLPLRPRQPTAGGHRLRARHRLADEEQRRRRPSHVARPVHAAARAHTPHTVRLIHAAHR